MKFIALCSLLLALCAVIGLLPASSAVPSRDSGGNSWRGGSSGSKIQQRPFYYDAPIRRPGQPQTRYA
ncbi:immune-induced peptide 18 [Drosophila innubila]|uniref:immune-induced peptide 18 n=1 Tax=Drosophila innubila TaxID=198719 RepID=UPI00148DBE88|nr:immune-induced peptide 18 [Drosophila innubila]